MDVRDGTGRPERAERPERPTGNTPGAVEAVSDAAGAVLRVSQVLGPITALGPGRRLGVWVQGCPLACAGCMSRHTWDPYGGQSVGVERLVRLWSRGLAEGYDGLTVSGGEPLEQPDALAALLEGADRVRRAAGRTDADLLVYTGWEDAEIAASDGATAALDRADAVITGRYRAGEPTRLVWRGSANQRLIPRTPLGRRRYGPHLRRESGRPELQVRVTDGAVHIVGVPRPGELSVLERDLAARGVTFQENTWRP
ncbi:4Fe-4S single cluster domain-containing protein [Streptomyces sp. SID3212]|uniref:4Fe-4S single cluster domain-containing protein n=1 Tax=Streptomyces sp. SID3212 TaxID=2690259 RepID=UPI0013694EB6|nr:4Fe-4S single cluster domain-containing protein [Streptomyces sp. SID3212]MYV52904.1 4Fe-4S cluster-binding domain-containing protein [Streptomyces sp. SID3212]